MNYSPQVMGEMLNAGFNNSELKTLAFTLDFNLPDEISHLPKSGKVIEIVRHAVRHGSGQKVVDYVQLNNRHQYDQFKSRLAGSAAPSNNSQSGSSTGINSGGGNVYSGDISVGGDFVGGDKTVTNNYHSSEDPELKEILSGISQFMEDLSEREPTPQTVINHNQTITFGDNATISGTLNAIQAEKIENSFNTVNNSAADGELKALLTTLLEQIKAVAEDAPAGSEGDVDEIIRNGDRMVDEATSSRPDRQFLGLSLDKLKQAAENIGELAVPVISTAVKIVMALGFG